MTFMEYGIRLTRPGAAPTDPREVCARPWRSLLPDGRAVALYFGAEFCEDRLPDLDEARAFCRMARERGWEPTLLTPLVTPKGLGTVHLLLAELVADGWRPAVVFNDWGVLELLRAQHPLLPRRAGRLMNRSLRDPRAYRNAPEGCAAHEASRFTRLHRLLADAGAAAVETDADLDGGFLGDGPDADGGLARALHLPYTFAASGRNCPLKALLYPQDTAFSKVLAHPCTAPCRSGPVPARRDDVSAPQWRGGNTLFYEIPQAVARGFLAHTDRVVLHEEAAP
jgi:hypothetical protein